MSGAIRWVGVAVLGSACAFGTLPAGAAGDDEPTPLAELDKLPVGLKVTHDPSPSRATETSNNKRLEKYTWFFKTTVRPTDSDVKVTEFGCYHQAGGKWEFNTITGKPFTPKNFAEWYSCCAIDAKGRKVDKSPPSRPLTRAPRGRRYDLRSVAAILLDPPPGADYHA